MSNPENTPEEVPAEIGEIVPDLPPPSAKPPKQKKGAGKYAGIAVIAVIVIAGIATALSFKRAADFKEASEARAEQNERIEATRHAQAKILDDERARKEAEIAAAEKAQRDAREAVRSQQLDTLLNAAKQDLETGNNIAVLDLEMQIYKIQAENAEIKALADKAEVALKESARHGDFNTILNAPDDNSPRIKKLKEWAAAAQKAAQPVDYTKGGRPPQ